MLRHLPVILASFVIMVPAVFATETRGAHRSALLGCVAVLAAVCAVLPAASHGFVPLVAAMVGFFAAFNVLEALQPALVSRVAPAEHKGLALGFYNTAQAVGLFLGGSVGGWLVARSGASAVFEAAAALAVIWLAVAWGMKPLPASRRAARSAQRRAA